MGILYLVATPIGNLEDFSPRAVRILREASLIAAEDTRHTRALLSHFDIHTPLTSYFEHNKLTKLEKILGALAAGDVALVSDAGTPAVNDPGYELVRAAVNAGFRVSPIPGASAPIAAFSASGIGGEGFVYLGYLPRKSGERIAALQKAAALPYPLIFFETPHRLVDALNDMLVTLGDRPLTAAREMTKLHEEFVRGTIRQVLAHFTEQEPRGEFVLVVGAKAPETEQRWDEEVLRESIQKEKEQGKKAKEIAQELAAQSGWSKKEVYALVVEGN